jgi:hypothetical protein
MGFARGSWQDSTIQSFGANCRTERRQHQPNFIKNRREDLGVRLCKRTAHRRSSEQKGHTWMRGRITGTRIRHQNHKRPCAPFRRRSNAPCIGHHRRTGPTVITTAKRTSVDEGATRKDSTWRPWFCVSHRGGGHCRTSRTWLRHCVQHF